MRLGSQNHYSPLLGLIHASTLRALERARRVGASPAALRYLPSVHKSLQGASLGNALRDIDRAWRSSPEDADSLAPIYGRLMSLEGQDLGAALRLLQQVRESDADIAAGPIARAIPPSESKRMRG